MTDWTQAVSEHRSGVVLTIAVTAGAKQDAFPRGYHPWRHAILCHVTAPAVDGRANKAVIEMLSATLGVPAQNIQILSGAHASQKRVLICGLSKGDLKERLHKLF